MIVKICKFSIVFNRIYGEMKEEYEVVKGIRFPKYSLKVVKYSKGDYGVVESFYFMKFCYKKSEERFKALAEAKLKYEDLHASRKFDHMTGK